MLRIIDHFLDRFTMYKVVLYILIIYVVVGTILGAFGILPYNPIALLFSAFFITTLCVLADHVFAWAFKVPRNVESAYITGIILALIILPIQSAHDTTFFSLAISASVLAIASKYILSIGGKHIFNPVAIAVAITAVTIGQSASWWIGTTWMLPFILIGGFLITRKIHRFDLVLSFCAVAIVTIIVSTFANTANILGSLWTIAAYTPLFFFATVMLTEPTNMPPTRWLRVIYGAAIGFFFSPAIHIASVYSTPELALVVGNFFSYIVSPKEKLLLKLKQVQGSARDTYSFIFSADRKINFKPGQYMEWTVTEKDADIKGNRRYFTMASSPTENNIMIGVRFYKKSSSFKQRLLDMRPDDSVMVGQRAGDFTLPKDKSKKLVFVAGGIGITPFRSMIKYLLDKKEKRDIVVMYSNRSIADVAYTDVFDEAYGELGIKTVYTLTDIENLPITWKGKRGLINEEMIRQEVPDFKERTFYVSGPHNMVTSFEDIFRQMGIDGFHIKKDFFSGYA